MLFQHGYALIVGVGRSAYPAWSLPTTASDAAALRAALTDPSLCAYPADDDHVRLLCDEGATRAALRDGLAWLARQAAADGDVTALVYISSHGWIDKATGRYYLLPHDVKPFDVPGSALAGEELAAALRAIDAPRLLVFVDSCHAAGMATAKDGDVLELPGQFGQAALPKGLADALRAGQGRAVFASSRGEQRSWLRPDRTLSLYTHHLLEGLRRRGQPAGRRRGAPLAPGGAPEPHRAGQRPPPVRGRADPLLRLVNRGLPGGAAGRRQGAAGRGLAGGREPGRSAGRAHLRRHPQRQRRHRPGQQRRRRRRRYRHRPDRT
ncbi:MAG: caspase family protein [Anaerolineae bacterium]